jgi:hypothetical protein
VADNKKLPEGAWVFVSHSHHDFEKVREIRNALEAEGHKPLLFFLKCLEDDSAQLPELLEKEIAARNFFLLCDSASSRSSNWVQREKQIAQSLQGKVIEEVDLDAGLEECLKKVKRLSRRATVFISCSSEDFKVAERIADRLREEDYRVPSPSDTRPDQSWAEQTESAIDLAARDGLLVMLLSHPFISSKYAKAELKYALSKGSLVVPILVENIDATLWADSPEIAEATFERERLDLSTQPFEEVMTKLITVLRNIEVGPDEGAETSKNGR